MFFHQLELHYLHFGRICVEVSSSLKGFNKMVSFADLLVRSPGVDAGEDKGCFRDPVIHQFFWPANCKNPSVNHD